VTRTSPLAWTAIGLAVAAQLLVAVLTTAFAGQVDPFRDPVSDYVFHRGGRALFAVAVLLVIASGAVLAAAARLAGLPVRTAVSVLFGLWLGGLVVVLVFRGNVSAAQPTLPGTLHRFGGAVLFASLPLACRALARQLRPDPRWAVAARRLGWSAIAGLTTAAAFGLAQFLPELPQGLLERLALTAELGILVTAALTVRSAAR
jgi:uncharacterized protein DUF998